MMGPKEGSVNPFLSAALGYAERGWPVFPCVERGKEPATAHGFKDATTDAKTIRAWWRERPLANVGIATGARSFDVLDVDGLEGEAALAALLAANGPLPRTTEVQTGRGRQLLFAPSGFLSKAAVLGRGLDTRGTGGYVIAPPSIHPNGTRYGFTYQDGFAPAPAWLAALVSKPKEAPKREAAPAPPRLATRAGGTTRYGSAALEALAGDVATAPEGERNATLNRAAHRAGKLVAGGEVDEAEARRALVSAAVAAGLEDAEIAKTVASGLSAGKTEPATAPPRPPLRLAPPPASPSAPLATEEVGPPPAYDLASVLEDANDDGPRHALGLPPLDALIGGGLPLGRVGIVTGQPGVGKTMLLVTSALALHASGFHVLVLCYDEPRESVAARLGKALGFAGGEVTYPPVVAAIREKADGRLFLMPAPSEPLAVEDAVARFLSLTPEGSRRAVVLDSVQTAHSREASDDDAERVKVARVMRALRAASVDGCIVLASSEMNRAAYASRDVNARTRAIASAAESRAIEYGADLMLALTFDDDEESTVRVEVTKTRVRPYRRGHVFARFDHNRSTFAAVDSDDHARSQKLGRELAAKDRDREDEAALLRVLDAAPDREVGVGRTEAVALSGVKAERARRAVARLLLAGTVEEAAGPARGGRPPVNLRRVIR